MLHFGPILLAAGLAASVPAAAQTLDVLAPSPLAKVEQRVGITDFSIEYSSPGVKGRTIWGDLVPHDELWRTGANAATKLRASRDFLFGGQKVGGTRRALTRRERDSRPGCSAGPTSP